jgi:hypothetical protein
MTATSVFRLPRAAIAVIVLGASVILAAGPALAAPVPVDLGTAGSFAVLAGTTVTNTGPTTVSGDLGVWPGFAVVPGASPGLSIVNGTQHANDAVAQQAQADTTAAYNAAAGQTPSILGTELGGQTTFPGVYSSNAGTFEITGTATLDAQGDPNAVFIFQTAATLVTASGSNVLLINGANPCNVFWQVGSSATLGTSSIFRGTILALTSITVTTGVTVEGRVLARNAAVTMDTNTITRGACTTPIGTPAGTPAAGAPGSPDAGAPGSPEAGTPVAVPIPGTPAFAG